MEVKTPLKVTFTWTTAIGRILTRDNFRKCHIIVMVWYCLYKTSGENLDHLFLHRAIARDLGNLVFQMFGLEWVMPKRVVDLLANWKGRVGLRDLKIIWNLIPS
jgi:hypothetical protein